MDFGVQFWEGSETASRTCSIWLVLAPIRSWFSGTCPFRRGKDPFGGIPCSTWNQKLSITFDNKQVFEQVRGMNIVTQKMDWIQARQRERERWPHFRLKKFEVPFLSTRSSPRPWEQNLVLQVGWIGTKARGRVGSTLGVIGVSSFFGVYIWESMGKPRNYP